MPMSGNFLLDTNTVIRLFAHDRAVEGLFDADPEVCLPIFVLGELYYGARKSRRVRENCHKIDDFASRVEVLLGDIDTAREFGKIKYELQLKGRMIPENDLWIAALARQLNLTLVSADRHFKEVDNLRLEQW
jgi:tRNA(fMet)-specific endonuclease VapC